MVRLAPSAVVNSPALANVIVVPTTLAPTKFTLSACPVKSNAPDKFRSPVNVVATEPAFCVKLAAEKP